VGRRAVVTGTTVVMAAGAAVAYLATLAANRSLVVVRGASMEPPLWAGDHLLTRPTWLGPIRAGQVVVVADPTDPSHLVVKRVDRADGGEVVVTGDNPAASTDSRTWGPLRPAAVRRVVLRRWPDLRTRLHR
jgi:nickel-type superoxide dismutase maturation protease